MPVALAAEALLAGSPVDVYTDGTGRMQFRYNGVADGEFFPPGSNTPNAGLAIWQNGIYSQPGSGATFVGPTIVANADGSHTLHSVYDIATNLRVTEDVTYANGSQTADVAYSIANRSPTAGSGAFRAGVLADLYVAGTDEGTGVLTGTAPSRFVGGRSAAGTDSGLTEITRWTHYQEGQYRGPDDVFAAFAAGGLADTINPNYLDNEVGVQWDVPSLAPSQSFPIRVRWTLAPPPPPPAATPTPTPIATPTPGLGPPVAGKSVNLHLADGKVLFKLPGAKTFSLLTADTQVPLGTTLDTTDGRVTLTSASDLTGGTNHAWFYEGVFKVGQTKGAKPITELTLAGAKPSCSAKKSSAGASAAAKKKTRKLWGDGAGQFRTRGQFSAATVRGTKWVVIDQCNGTLTRVASGTVSVRDFVKRKTVLVRAGKQYLARAKKK